jgi:hypothetical protein
MLVVLKSGSLNLLEPSGSVQGCSWIAFPLPLSLLRFASTKFHEMPFSTGMWTRKAKVTVDFILFFSFCNFSFQKFTRIRSPYITCLERDVPSSRCFQLVLMMPVISEADCIHFLEGQTKLHQNRLWPGLEATSKQKKKCSERVVTCWYSGVWTLQQPIVDTCSGNYVTSAYPINFRSASPTVYKIRNVKTSERWRLGQRCTKLDDGEVGVPLLN